MILYFPMFDVSIRRWSHDSHIVASVYGKDDNGENGGTSRGIRTCKSCTAQSKPARSEWVAAAISGHIHNLFLHTEEFNFWQ